MTWALCSRCFKPTAMHIDEIPIGVSEAVHVACYEAAEYAWAADDPRRAVNTLALVMMRRRSEPGDSGSDLDPQPPEKKADEGS